MESNNMQAVNQFLQGVEITRCNPSSFLFEMLTLFTRSENDNDYSDKYRQEVLANFELLHTLINNLQPVKNSITQNLN